MDPPVSPGRLAQHDPMEHRHVAVHPNGKAHESLGQAQHLRAQPRLRRENQHQVHQQQQEVQYVTQGLQHLQPHVGGPRRGVEEPQGLEAGHQGRQAEDGEVDGEVEVDENEDFLEREVGFDLGEDKRD